MKDEEKDLFGTNVNEIIELNSDEEEDILEDDNIENEPVVDQKLEKKKQKKENKLVCAWKQMSKKKKIILIVILSLIIILVVGLILFFALHKEQTRPSVILQEDNYRYENGKLVFLNKDKNEIGTYECEHKDENLCYVAYYKDEDNLDIDVYKNEDDSSYLKRSLIYKDNFVFITDTSDNKNTNVKLYNIKTNSVDGEYAFIKNYGDYVIVSKDDKYGILEFESEKAITKVNMDYDFLGYYPSDENIIFKDKTGYGIMDVDKKIYVSKIKEQIRSYTKDLIVAALDSNYIVYDYSGKKVSLMDAEYIKIVSDYILLINDKKLYVYDLDYNLLNMDGLQLETQDYNNIIVVDKNGEVKETKRAFEFNVDGDSVKIKINDNEFSINVNEAKINNNLAYIKYSDNKLYFYSDKEKTKSLGKYNCQNANNVSKDDIVFNNCFLAKESKLIERKSNGDLGYLPIYNDRFVFIQDEQTGSSSRNIVFYDLKMDKVLSNYTEVDAGYYNKTGFVNMASSDNAIIIARKQNGIVLAFNITSNGVETIIKSNYNATEIKYLNEYLLAKYNDGTYHLFKNDGTEITKNISTTSEIVNYYNNYIVVKNNDKYQIYNLENGQIISDEFNYVDLNGTYYVGIINKKLNVYNYNSKNKLLCKDLEIDGDDYPNLYTIKYYNASNIIVTIQSKEYSFAGNMEYTVDGVTHSCELENEE